MPAPRTLKVYKEIEGPFGFGEGQGADMVPSGIAHGGIGTYVVPEGSKSNIETSPSVERVLFEIHGLTEMQALAASSVVSGLTSTGVEVTRERVFEELQKVVNN